MPAVVNGVLYNTESGLTPTLDRLSAILGENAKFQSRQQTYEDVGLLPKGSAGSLGGGIMSMLGLSGQRDAAPTPPMPMASASTHVQPQNAALATGGPTPAGLSSPPVGAAPSPLSGFQGLIDKTQAAYGIPAGYLPKLASIESRLNPGAVSPTGAKGLYQFTSGTAARYGLDDPTDVASSTDAAGRLTRDNAAVLTRSLGRAPTAGELYLAHQQGAAGAAALLKNPQIPAGQVLASIGADPNNVKVNGGDPGMPAGVFASKWTSRFDGAGGAQPAQDAGSSATAAAPAPQFPNAPPGLAGITAPQIQALLRNPETEQLGLKLWQSAATGKNFDFHMGPDGTVVRENKQTGQAEVLFRAPVKSEFHEMNGRALAFDPQSSATKDVTPAGMPQGFRSATPQERQAYGVQPDAPLFFGPDGKPGTLNGGTNVTVNNGADPLRKAVGDRFDKSLQAADSAAKLIPSIQVARQQLQSGIISGAGANQMLGLQKIGAAFGVTDPHAIRNTETFRAAVGPIVLGLVRNLGSGSGITDADREFAEKMAGGNITLDPGSIGRILDIQERAARATVAQHNAFVDQLTQSKSGASAYRDVGAGMRVELPVPGQPQAAPGQMPARVPSGVSKTIGGVTYTRGADGHWYAGH